MSVEITEHSGVKYSPSVHAFIQKLMDELGPPTRWWLEEKKSSLEVGFRSVSGQMAVQSAMILVMQFGNRREEFELMPPEGETIGEVFQVTA